MSKKIIFIIIIVIIAGVIGAILYFNIMEKRSKPEATPELIIPLPEPWDFRAEGYVLLGVENSTYHIISGQLTPEQVKKLAEKVIEDIFDETPGLEKITLFFYSELVNIGIDEPDIARIDWSDGVMNTEIK